MQIVRLMFIQQVLRAKINVLVEEGKLTKEFANETLVLLMGFYIKKYILKELCLILSSSFSLAFLNNLCTFMFFIDTMYACI